MKRARIELLAILLALMTAGCDSAGFGAGSSHAGGTTPGPSPSPEAAAPPAATVPEQASGSTTAGPPPPAGPALGSSSNPTYKVQTGDRPPPADLPPNAVTKGSFTVYSVPSNPDVGQDYQLVILVSLPPGTAQYQVSDLSGNISGSDGWRQSVTQSLKRAADHDPSAIACGTSDQYLCDAFPVDFSVSGTTAQMTLWVPGADYRGVQDTVAITSMLLNDTESIQVLFQ